MEAIIKRKVIKSLTLLWLMWIVVIGAFTFVLYIAGGIDVLKACLPAQKITPGEKLSNYEGRKVSCSIHYVAYPMLQYYSASDPSRRIYATGYVALDDQLKNPFCVFVPVSKESEMNYLLDRAWSRREGDMEIPEPLTVKGIVSKLPDDDRQYYVEAVQTFYGNDKPLYGDIFYIDDQNVVGRRQTLLNMFSRTAFMGYWYTILFLAFTVWVILCTVRSFRYPKVINEFALLSGMGKSRLETEFTRAEEVCKGVWISPEITVYYDIRKFGILLNKNLVWVYVNTFQDRLGGYVNHLELFDKNQKQCAHVRVNDKYNDILHYYEMNCPHMVIGDDEEKRNMFKFAFDKFLRLRYYWNINMRYDEPPAELKPDFDNDLCGYQNLSFDEESGRYENDTF